MCELQTAVVSYMKARSDLAETTRKQQRWQLGRFMLDLGPEREVGGIRPAHIEGWISGQRWTPATARTRVSLLRTFFRWCLDRRHIRRDPMTTIRSPKLPRSLPRGLSLIDVAAALRACPDARSRLIILLMCQEGLRCIEVSRLEVGHVDFGDRLILVRGKGGHERILPFSDETSRAMDSYLVAWPIGAGPLVRSYQHPHGPVTAAYISALVGEAMRAAGIKKRPYDGVSAHACRHTMATDLVRSGAHLRDVQNALGHTSLATTQRYLPWLVGDLREAMAGRSYGDSPVAAVVSIEYD